MFENILITKPHNKHHLNRYIRFIKWCKQTPPQETGVENHHICPKSADLFPEFESFIEHPWNKVPLTQRQHYLAHWMLWKAFGGKQTQAFKLMSERCDRRRSRCYENVKIDHGTLMSENNPNATGKFSKKYWETASQERRDQQASIMRAVNAKKIKPRIVRTYCCTNCGNLIEKEEFAHHPPRINCYCNTSCRAKYVASYRKSIVGFKHSNRIAHNKGKKGTGFGARKNPMHDPILVQRMLDSRARNKKMREIIEQGLPQTSESD